MVPPVSASVTGTGTATVRIDFDDDADELEVEVALSSGVRNITGVHVHLGGAGSNGPVLFTVSSGGGNRDEFEAELEAADLQAAPELGVTTMRDALSAILCGQAYLDVHTSAHPQGEIRGQIGAS